MSDFSELEIELKKLRPVQPSEDLVTRIEHALAEPPASAAGAGGLPKSQPLSWNWLTLGLGVAAAFLVMARIGADRPATQSPAVASAPSAASSSTAEKGNQLMVSDLTQVVYNTRDEGLLFNDDATQPVRRLRSQTRETLQWRNPNTGASLRVSYPSEEISLIPVSGQ